MPKVKFIKSPSCEPYKLAYHIGDVAEVDNKTAVALIEAKFATPVTGAKVEKAVAPHTNKETRGAAKPKAKAAAKPKAKAKN